MILAHEPWSGYYVVREALWGYAHYGQFTRLGWQYVDDACTKLDGGGSLCMLRDPATDDYSIIVETKDAKAPQTVRIRLPKGLSTDKLCVWLSNEEAQFVRQADLTPRGRTLVLNLDPGSVYSFSTTRGQVKGAFDDIPASKPFPLPYEDAFE